MIALHPKKGATGETLFAQKCGGCRQPNLMSSNRIGPDLPGIVGRQIASVASYPDYSSSLRGLGGIWTEDRLDEFLRHQARSVLEREWISPVMPARPNAEPSSVICVSFDKGFIARTWLWNFVIREPMRDTFAFHGFYIGARLHSATG
ncbi:hypothetical protein IVB40_22285 [Bradyrhizobium sp. 40]|nr:hypothetical protein IVB40_22285 [Bradyrhizobium sp. 40]